MVKMKVIEINTQTQGGEGGLVASQTLCHERRSKFRARLTIMIGLRNDRLTDSRTHGWKDQEVANRIALVATKNNSACTHSQTETERRERTGENVGKCHNLFSTREPDSPPR